MNDEPAPGRSPGRRRNPIPLDDTQRVEVPRYAPTPDPAARRPLGVGRRPASPPARARGRTAGDEPAGARRRPPATYGAPRGRGRAGAWGAAPGAAGTPRPAWASARAGRHRARRAARRGGAGIGTIVDGLAAVGRARLGRHGARSSTATGAFDQPAPASTIGTGQQTGRQLPVTIDESSAVIDAAAKVGPAVVKIDDRGPGSRPVRAGDQQGVGSGVIYDANGWILTNRHVVADADQAHRRAQGRPPVRRHGLRHRHPDRPRDRQGRRRPGLPAAPIGHSDGLKIGQLVVAIGSPLGHLLVLGHERDRVRQGPRRSRSTTASGSPT